MSTAGKAFLLWLGVCCALLLIAVMRARARDRARRGPDFRDTADFLLGADAWCHAHPDALAAPPAQTSAPTPGLTLARQQAIQAEARCTARGDYIDNRRRRANPHARHSREFALWAIAYDEAWTAYELAAHGCTESLRAIPDRTA